MTLCGCSLEQCRTNSSFPSPDRSFGTCIPPTMSRSEDEHKSKMAAESAHAGEDYEADEFEPVQEEHKDSPAAAAAASVNPASSYESEPFASASDEEEEEEVFSTPDAHVPPKGLEIMQQRAAAARAAATAAPRRHPAASTCASAAPQAKQSSLPSLSGSSSSSLGGLPSIGLMSSNLTAAGRAHFGNSASLFGKPSQSNAAASAPAAPVSTTSDSSISAAALAAYAASNRLHASEYLGIHALQVAPCSGVSEVPAASSGAIIELDSGRLRIWCGAMEQPDLGSAPVGMGGADVAGFKLPSGIFLRAALTASADSAAPPLHISIDNSDPLSSPSGSAAAATTSSVDADGAPAAEVPSCFHAHRLGSYRLRVVARGSSMPSAPDSFTEFVTRAAAQSSDTKADGTAAAIAAAEQSPFDLQPRLTLYIAVEKLSADRAPNSSPAAAASKDAASSSALPLLPVGASHTFWLSTHQGASASPAAAGASHSGSSSQTTLVFANPSDPSNDHLELSLAVVPMHADILKQLTLTEPELDEQDAEPKDTEAASSSSAASTRKGKKKQKSNAKKKRSKNRQAELENSPQPPLVDVGIVAADPCSSSPSEAAPLAAVTIHPASAGSHPSSSAASGVAAPAAAGVVAPQQPSLIDLLATLVVSPSQSLPSSILAAGQSVAQVAQLTSQISRAGTGAAAAAAGSASGSAASSNASLPSVGASSTASATSVPSSGPGEFDPLLLSLDRRVHWPFSVSLDAIRVSDECEGHASVADSLCLDRLHNRTIPKSRAATKRNFAAEMDSLQKFLVGDHEVELLRTVGLLCAWNGPRDGSALNRPVLVSQQPLLSYHLQCRITRLDADEANARAMDAVLDL